MENNKKTEQSCEFIENNKALIEKVKEKMPPDNMLYDVSELFSIFADSTRVKILYVLSESEMCVCAIAELLGMTQSAISHQLRILKQARLVKYRRNGKTIYYSLNDDHISQIFNMAMQHVAE